MSYSNHSITLYNDGLTHLNNKLFTKSIKLFLQAIKKEPRFFEAFTGLGKAYQGLGNKTDALKSFKKAYDILPNHPLTLTNYANALKDLNQLASAKSLYLNALKIDPGFSLAIANLALLYAADGDFDNSLIYLKKYDGTPSELINLISTACDYIPKESSFKDTFLLLIYKSIRLISNENLWEKKLISEINALSAESCSIHSLVENLLLYKEDESLLELTFSIIHGLESFSDCTTKFYYFLGRLYLYKGKVNEAIAELKKSLELDYNPNTLSTISDAYYWSGDIDKSLAFIKKASFKSSFIGSYSKMCLDFIAHDFQTAWDRYRLDKVFSLKRSSIPFTEEKELHLSESICIHLNQGIGDQILFLSFLKDFQKSFPSQKLFIKCDERLHEAILRSYSNISIYKDIEASPETKHVFLSDFGSLLRPNIDSFTQGPYLLPDDALVKFYKEKLSHLEHKINIGIAWKGGSIRTAVLQQSKSCTLNDFEPLLKISGVNFINLQYGDTFNELQSIKQNLNIDIIDFDDVKPLEGIDRQMALISNLDLVVQVSNASLHMAGALGVNTFALISTPHDFRWFPGKSSTDTPWYNNMTLFRKKNSEEWRDLILKAAKKIKF